MHPSRSVDRMVTRDENKSCPVAAVVIEACYSPAGFGGTLEPSQNVTRRSPCKDGSIRTGSPQ